MHIHTVDAKGFKKNVSSYRTALVNGQAEAYSFERGGFEFQRGAHERAAEYKGVPKDTLQRSM